MKDVKKRLLILAPSPEMTPSVGMAIGIPTYNERLNIVALVERLRLTCAGMRGTTSGHRRVRLQRRATGAARDEALDPMTARTPAPAAAQAPDASRPAGTRKLARAAWWWGRKFAMLSADAAMRTAVDVAAQRIHLRRLQRPRRTARSAAIHAARWS